LRIALSIIAIFIAYWSSAQQPLVGIEDGQWFTIDRGSKTVLSRDIHDVSNFDSESSAYFMRHDLYGLIDPKGKVVLPEEFVEVEQLRGGYYKFLRKDGFELIQVENQKLKRINCRSIQSLENNWFIVMEDTTSFLLNSLGNYQLQLGYKDKVLNSFHGYLFLLFDGERLLFDPQGNKVDFVQTPPQFREDHLLLLTPDSKMIVYADHTIELPSDAENINVEEYEIYYTSGEMTRIISSDDKKLIMEVKCESLRAMGRGFYQMRAKNKAGVISKDGDVICPMKYDFISIRGNYLMIVNGQGTGVIDFGGRIVLPCVYDWVTISRDFILVESSLGKQGILSRKTNKMILPCVYQRIAFSDSKIRAWSTSKLRILELDTLHNVLSDLVLDNVITLDRVKASEENPIDSRLYGLGWFNKLEPVFDTSGYKIGDKMRWGLKGMNDTTLLKAKYTQPLFVPQADFSLIQEGSVKSEFSMNEANTKIFNVTSHVTGKRLIPESVFSVDSMDLFSRSYTRFYGKKGFGVLTAENKVVRMQYIDGYDRRYVRYCQSKEPKIEKGAEDDYDALKYPDGYMNNDPGKTVKYTVGKSDWEYVKFVDAEWNFLDTNGRPLFDTPFSFVYPYQKRTAIVQREGKWGLARADSLVIELIYAQISRMSDVTDTLLLVKYLPKGSRFMDTTANELDLGITRFGLTKGGLTQVYFGALKGIVNSDYKIVSGNTRFQKVFNNGLFYSKEKKEYTIYDSDGRLKGTIKLKPIDFIQDEYVIVEERRKKGVVDMFDEVVIPFEYKKIEKVGNYIFAINGVENLLYDENFKLIKNCKSDKILVDQVTGNYAVIRVDRAIVYSIATQKKIGTWKGAKFGLFNDGWLINYGKESRSINVNTEEVLDLEFEIKEVVGMEGSGYIIHDRQKKSRFFSMDWSEDRKGSILKRAKYIGSGRGVSKTKNGLLLFGDGFRKFYKGKSRYLGDFGNGYLLIGQKNNYEFVNVEGENVFKRKFKDATPFGSEYATIKEKTGWTIMDANGYYKTLPSYEKIEEVGPNIFSTSKQAVYGVFDSHGNEIIPLEYQKINIINDELLQGYKEGEIYYFNIRGEEISIN